MLFGLVIMLAACKQTPQQKAEALVKKYLDTSLNDPKSYESVSFGLLEKLKGKPYKGDNIDTVDLEILHSYRYKNEYGAIVKKTGWFIIDPNFRHLAYSGIDLNKYNAERSYLDTLSSIKIDTSARPDTTKKLLHR